MSLQMYANLFHFHVFHMICSCAARCELTVFGLDHPPPLTALSTLVIADEPQPQRSLLNRMVKRATVLRRHFLSQDPICLILRSITSSFFPPFFNNLPPSLSVTALRLHFGHDVLQDTSSICNSLIRSAFLPNLCTLEIECGESNSSSMSTFADHVLLHSSNLTKLTIKTCTLAYCTCNHPLVFLFLFFFSISFLGQ